MTNYIILLPPSEGKIKGGDNTKPYRLVQNLKKYNTFISLESEREYIYDKLREAISLRDEKDLEKIFELKGKKLQEAIEITLDLLNEETLPAIQRYSGVMFKAINYSALSEKQKQNFNTSTIFIDGLFGLLKPQDLIPEYKLKITSKFDDINITLFWKQRLKGIFTYLFKDKIIIDLLPQSHRKVVDYSTALQTYLIHFKTIKKDKLINVGHESKKLKGELIAYLTKYDTINREILEKFTHSLGFKYSPELSDKTNITYLN